MKVIIPLILICFTLQKELNAQENIYQGYTYTFQIPIGWSISEDPTGTVDIILQRLPNLNTTNFSVSTKGVAEDKDIYGGRNTIIAPIKLQYPNAEITKEEKITVIDNPSDLQLEFVITLADGREVLIIQYIFVMDNVNYLISGLKIGPDPSELRQAIKVVVNSFKPKN